MSLAARAFFSRACQHFDFGYFCVVGASQVVQYSGMLFLLA